MSRDEIHGMSSTGGDSSSGGAASPLTARSMRLERVAQALAHSQEELRRYDNLHFFKHFVNFLRFEMPTACLVACITFSIDSYKI